MLAKTKGIKMKNLSKQYLLLSLVLFAVTLLVNSNRSYADEQTITTTTVTTTEKENKNIPDVKPSTPEHQYITFDINMNRVYQNNQRVDGQVVIHNAYSEALPGKFHIKLYQQDLLKKEYETSIPELLPGDNVLTLERLGIPDINNSKRDQGSWTIVVYPTDLGPDYSKEAKFKILSSLNDRER